MDDVLRDGRGWAFRESTGADDVNGFALLRRAYQAVSPGCRGHVGIPRALGPRQRTDRQQQPPAHGRRPRHQVQHVRHDQPRHLPTGPTTADREAGPLARTRSKRGSLARRDRLPAIAQVQCARTIRSGICRLAIGCLRLVEPEVEWSPKDCSGRCLTADGFVAIRINVGAVVPIGKLPWKLGR
jgi:hypothetical protein